MKMKQTTIQARSTHNRKEEYKLPLLTFVQFISFCCVGADFFFFMRSKGNQKLLLNQFCNTQISQSICFMCRNPEKAKKKSVRERNMKMRNIKEMPMIPKIKNKTKRKTNSNLS